MTRRELAQMIDHTVLGPTVTAADVDRACDECANGFYSVCVPPALASRAVTRLRNTNVRVGSVVGFPHGNTTTMVKVIETSSLLQAGVREIDMVMCVSALLGGDSEQVVTDLTLVADVVRGVADATLKVILETALLSPMQVNEACELCVNSRAHFVKTSTGFGPGGADANVVAAMRAAVGNRAGVKASGGIRDTSTALAMIEAGANRIGSSSSLAILAGLEE